MLIYKLQRVARHKSHSPALTCSMCQFGMKNCIFRYKIGRFGPLLYSYSIKKATINQLLYLSTVVRTPKIQIIMILNIWVNDFSEGV